MESARFTGLVVRAALFVAVFGLSLGMACARIAEAPASPLAWLRICVTLGAVGIVAFARRQNIVQRALLAFTLEAVSGVATLLYVDVPFVNQHAVPIASGVAASYHHLTKRNILADIKELAGAR